MISKETMMKDLAELAKDSNRVKILSLSNYEKVIELAGRLYDYLADDANIEKGEDIVSEETMINHLHVIFDKCLTSEELDKIIGLSRWLRDYLAQDENEEK